MQAATIENKKAYFDYQILEKYEAGISLKGNEVKSIRTGKASIKEAWISIDNNEMFLKQSFISSYDYSNRFDIHERRDRKLLLHRREINNLQSDVKKEGLTLIPLKIYFINGRAKVLIGLCKGKHLYDKRESIKKRDCQREIRRNMKR